jgi:hypothetical protein
MAKTISSMEQAERLVPSLARALQQDALLAQRALANPLLAIEELGYQIAPDLRAAVERRVRFSLQIFDKLQQLSEQIQLLAGHPFDVDSSPELDAVLFSELGLPRPPGRVTDQLTPKQLPPGVDFTQVTAPLPWQAPFAPRLTDPLEALRGQHPIMEPLLEYRILDASEPRLAPPEVYEQLRRGELTLPIGTVRFRLQKRARTRAARPGRKGTADA